MMAFRVLSRIPRGGAATAAHRAIMAASRPEAAGNLSVPYQSNRMLSHSTVVDSIFQRFGFSSTASPEPTEKDANQSPGHDNTSKASSEAVPDIDPTKKSNGSTSPGQTPDADAEGELSMDELVKLVAEKEELLKLKHKEIEKMQDKVLRSYAEMENVIDRTKREAENSKKYAIQSFAKSLLDVADNLARASSVVKESFSKLDTSKDNAGAVPLLKTLLEGVEMTEKQLSEVFRKFGVEKFDPTNEHFDPHRHLAVFQIKDASKPPGTVSVVIKTGYMLHDRVLRPAEVGVTEANNETDENSSE
uniref:GrpE protein homolog n=1 Tax=Ananas comosus var. bracteatus TaxID=296719 RepID=A0A6V7NWQ2_ANACO|nr:unnamed protein product [Ananas comosus var. bracteatus]